jgi:hypothetical protein
MSRVLVTLPCLLIVRLRLLEYINAHQLVHMKLLDGISDSLILQNQALGSNVRGLSAIGF